MLVQTSTPTIDHRYLQHGIFLGFPAGRSPAGDLATAVIRQCVGKDAYDLKFTRIGKDRDRSYWCSAFNEDRVRHCIRVLVELGFDATGNQHRTVNLNGEHTNWTMHVGMGKAAIQNADDWKAKKLDLAAIVARKG